MEEYLSAQEILVEATRKNASDIFIVAGLPISFKIAGKIIKINETKLMPNETKRIITEIYELALERKMKNLLETGDDDFSLALQGLSRFRVCTYQQRGSFAAVIRVIAFSLPDSTDLGIPDSIIKLGDINRGLVLVTGPAGSGKSTTLACIIDYINNTQSKHIITLEDPLEFLHRHNKSIVSQREINTDTKSYVNALRAALRQSPDVILLGEMRDYETISVAMTAAETGHLVISTLHTTGTVNTIDRIIDVFPSNQQHQIAVQLASVLQAVVSQQLLPETTGELIPAFELMMMTPAIRNMIRENKVHQIDGVISASSNINMGKQMFSMDSWLIDLWKKKKITAESAVKYAINAETMFKKIK